MIEKEEFKEFIKDSIEEIFFSEDEYSPFNILKDNIKKLLTVNKYEERLESSIRYSDKFEDYMKNIDKLNELINEFKGLVSIVRGEASRINKQNNSYKKMIKQLLQVLNEE
jgi:phosphoenolpyruvate carboxylase